MMYWVLGKFRQPVLMTLIHQVQPQSDAAELVKLKSSMNEFYNKEEPFVDVSKIKENELYAVTTGDHKWSR